LQPHISYSFFEQVIQVRYLKIWGSSVIIAIALKIFQIFSRFGSHPLFIPAYYLIIPLGFYLVAFLFGNSVESLRDDGWLFNLQSSHSGKQVSFWEFWTYYNFRLVDWKALLGNNIKLLNF
jgi:SulP family sulfate permease